jgi:HK97 family phage major capsid protein
MDKKALQAKLARLANEMRAKLALAKTENRSFTSLEREEWDKSVADFADTEATLKAIETSASIDARLALVPQDAILDAGVEEVSDRFRAKRKTAATPHDKAFSAFLRNGTEGLDPDQRQLMAANFKGPAGIKNAQTLTTTGGGYLIPQGFSDMLEEALKWYGGILGNVGEFNTETGNPLPWPTLNDTTNVGTIIGVNTQLTEVDLVFAQVTFNAYIFSSGSVIVPLALIQDSYFDLDALVAKQLGIRLGRALNKFGTTGTGTNQPNGIVTAAVAEGNTVEAPTGNTTAVTYSSLVNLLHAVDPAYREMPSARFMFHDSTLKAIRQLVDGNNRPLWQPGINAGFGSGFPETILDKKYVVNNDMAVMAANAESILFGDMSKYMVRRVAGGATAGGVTIMRLVERYADYLQVGFQGFLRADGQLLDAGTHPIAVYVNSAT